MSATLTLDPFAALSPDELAQITGAGFWDGAGRVLNAMGHDAQNGAAAGAVGGAVVGGVAGGIAGAGAGGVGAATRLNHSESGKNPGVEASPPST